MKYTFKPNFTLHKNALPGVVSTQKIQVEPMLYQASTRFAWSHGGELTRDALSFIAPFKHKNWVIDTRTHMLMPGHLPAIGGWHCDWIPRTVPSRDGYQPDLNLLNSKHQNYVITLSDNKLGVSHTQYIDQEVEIEVNLEGKVWSQVDAYLERTPFRSFLVSDGTFVRFSRSTLHTASPAHSFGWRWFFRASQIEEEPKNQIRHQSMVYIRETGW